MAKVTVNYRATINLGNYESIQYGVGIELECPDDAIKGTKEALSKALEQDIIKKVKEIRRKGREHFGFDIEVEDWGLL